MTSFKTIALDDLAFVTGGNKTDLSWGPLHFGHETDPETPDPDPYLRCRKQSYDQSPVWDQWFRPDREERFAERACGQYRPH